MPVRKKRAKAKKKVVRKRATRKRATRRPTKRRTKRRTKRASASKRVVKRIERSSVERVIQGKRKRKRRRTRRRVSMAGRSRRRYVGKRGGGKGLMIAVGLGAIALLLLSKKQAPTYPGGSYSLPPVTQTQNLTRNTQANDIVQYAMAGGLAIDAIIKLIDRLNTSNDQEVQNIYDHVNTTGDIGVYV